jgi:tetratricopeptide (TPR) repeat protein
MKAKIKKQASNILMSQAKPSALPVDTHFHLAVSFHQQGRLEDAAKLYESVVIANPLHDEAWHMYGLVANKLGNHKQAIELITKSINLDLNSFKV